MVSSSTPKGATPRRRRGVEWLFALLALVVCVPFVYDRIHPTVLGFPLFVAMQFGIVLLGSVLTGIVYVVEGGWRRTETGDGAPAAVDVSDSPMNEGTPG